MSLGSIRGRVLILIGLIFSVVLCVAAYSAYERRNADYQVALDALQANATFISEKQGDALRYTAQFLSFLMQTTDISALANDPDCRAKVTRFIELDPHLANIFITDVNGQVICSALHENSAVNISDRALFPLAMAADAPVLGEALFGRLSKKWVLPFAQRFKDANGNPKGALVVSLDLSWVNQEFGKLAATPEMRVGLLTAKGVILARYPEPEKWIGKQIRDFPGFQKLLEQGGYGTAESVSHDGTQRVYAFAHFTETEAGPIYLWLTLPTSTITAKADHQFAIGVGLALLLAAIFYLIALYSSNRFLVRPIETIVHAAHDLAMGKYAARTGLKHTADEIGQLALAFDEMAHQLNHLDALTGLQNLFAFDETLSSKINEAQAQQRPFAILQIGIANFHRLQGHYGIDAGHEMLKVLARRLQNAASNDCVLARLEEDNFAIAAPRAANFEQAEWLVDYFHKSLTAQPVQVDGSLLYPEINFGVSFYPADGQSIKELLQHAGVALEHAKSDKNAHLCFFEQGMNDLLLKRTVLTQELRQAINQQQLLLHYQPQIDTVSGKIVGFEALVRWQHPVHGLLMPNEFIAWAEETGLIVPMGDWVLERALNQLKEWIDAGLADASITMAVNISALQLSTGELLMRLQQLLTTTGLPPGSIELELTESQLLGDISAIQSQLRKLTELGIQISIDDFGTGYSSLSYLKNYAVDKLKIDKSFIDNLTTVANDAAIVQATIAMAHNLGLLVIAEGVETEAQAQHLRELCCDQLQGYYFSRPLPAQNIENLLRQKQACPSL